MHLCFWVYKINKKRTSVEKKLFVVKSRWYSKKKGQLMIKNSVLEYRKEINITLSSLIN